MTRHPFLARVFICCVALGSIANAQGATVSGKLVHRDSTPAAGITVTLVNKQGRSAPVQSDSNGSYTLYKIPAGLYYLEVWVNPSMPQTSQVTIKEPSTPLPQVTVP